MDKPVGVPFTLLVLCVVFTVGNSFVITSGKLTSDEAMEYLKEMKYINNNVPEGDMPAGTVVAAISKFQEMANLPVTGELNDETLRKMAQPRCGFPDVRRYGRPKYATENRWPKNRLTWKITEYSNTSMLRPSEQKNAMTRAFNIWTKVTPLSFQYVGNRLAMTDLDIKFVSKDHGDGTPFDGPGRLNAHAFFPQLGKIHFDDDETWLTGTSAAKAGLDLFIVAAHEFGHALGLQHSDVPGSLMGAFYVYTPNLQLHEDDIMGIQHLYGKPSPKRKSAWWFLKRLL